MKSEINKKCHFYECENETHFGYLFCKMHQELLPKMKIVDATDEIELSVRAYNCLNKSKIEYLEDFIFLSDEELKSIKNLGMKTLNEIREITDELLPFCHKDSK